MNLSEHRKYYREEKTPALERLFDVLKEGLAASVGNAASWLLSEYNEVQPPNRRSATSHSVNRS
jgi:hypothetical protein